MNTSPEHDGRLLTWIDATGPVLDGGMVDTSSCFDDAARRACSSQAPAAQTYAIRLPDGAEVEWTAEQIADYDGDWHVNLTIEQADTLIHAIMSDE